MSILSREAEFFLAVCETGNLARAADRLELSQPALSRGIQRLEAQLGARLFDRAPRGVELTPMGEALRSRLAQANVVLDDARHEITQLAGGQIGLLRLGAGHLVSKRLARTVIPRLLLDRPAANVQLRVNFNAELLDRLRGGELDFVVCGLPEGAVDDLQSRELVPTDLVVVVRAGHPLTALENPTPQDLIPYRSAGPAPNVTARLIVEARLATHGVPVLPPIVQADDMNVLLEILTSSDLYSMAPRLWLHEPEWTSRLKALDIEALSFPQRFAVFWRRGAYVSPLALRAIELAEEEFGSTRRSGSE